MAAGNNIAPNIQQVDDIIVCVTLADGSTRTAVRLFNEKTGQHTFEDGGSDITGLVVSFDEGACSTSQIVREFCDDVNGDGTLIVPYYNTYVEEVVAGSLSLTLTGSFADDLLTVPYAPTNPVRCDEVGQLAHMELLALEDNNGICFYRWVDVLTGTAVRDFLPNGSDHTAATPVKPVGGGSGTGSPAYDGVVTNTSANPVPVQITKTSSQHTVSSGVDTTIPAGLKSVVIKATSGGVSVGSYTMNNNETLSFEATTNNSITGTLPAISPSGGNWTWIALDYIEV